MYEFKVVITDDEVVINRLLEVGWLIHSITPGTEKFCFVLKK